jgi:predicted transposase/invertase (TIGR01784 family)
MLGLSELYREQIPRGQKCDTIKKVYSIQILCFTVYKNEEEYHHVFRNLRTISPHMAYCDNDMEIHIIELPKFKKGLSELESSLNR